MYFVFSDNVRILCFSCIVKKDTNRIKREEIRGIFICYDFPWDIQACTNSYHPQHESGPEKKNYILVSDRIYM